MRYLAIALLLAQATFGYIRQTDPQTGVPLVRVDNTGIQFNLDQSVVAGAQSNLSGKNITVITSNSDPFGAARGALATWNAVTTANIKFLKLQNTTAGINPGDYIMTIAVAATSDELSVLGGPSGVIAFTVDTYATGSGVVNGWNVQDGSIIDSDIVLNPSYSFSTTGASGTYDLQAVLTHELGHSLSSNHVGLLGATMYPYTTQTIQRNLSSDDLDLVNQTYPLPSGAPASGTISGNISTTSNQPAPYALVTVIDQADGLTYEAMTNATGAFTLAVPPASYIVYAEPFNFFVNAGNFYLTATQQASAIAFQPGFFGSALNPTSVAVPANGAATANISVTPGTSSLGGNQLLLYGFGTPGKTGDVKSFTGLNGPILLASGQSIDFVFSGPGYTSSFTAANVLVFGQGIQVTAVKVDSSGETVAGLPVLRATLQIAAHTNTSLASLIMTKGGNTTAFTGLFLVTPPTPVAPSGGVVNAASGVGAAVSPGEMVSIYGTNVGPSGPYFGGNLSFFDQNGYLTADLFGAAVTFNGVPAPMLYAGPGQLNVVVPFEVTGSSAQVIVTNGGSPSTSITVPVASATPGIFENPTGSGIASANFGNGAPVTQSNPAPLGSTVVVYGTGIGAPSFALPTGEPSPAPPTISSQGYTCTIGGEPAAISFTGLTQGFVGLVQWNVTIPTGLTTIGAVPMVITSPSGQATQTVNIYVQ
jgi:uncharacterized protein (TIGR03437 family)